jgi:hypothetical protein
VAHYGCGQQITHIFDKQIGVNMKNQPAFPCQYDEYFPLGNGMTLRDYFAAKAMQSILSSDRYVGLIGLNRYEQRTAEDAYKMADAMLKSRGQ